MLASCVLAASVLFAATPARAQDLGAELKDMTFIGFQQFKEASRVFVKTTEPVKYRVDTSRDDLIILVLENASISNPNNARFLDTRFFASPVSFVQPRVIEGPSPSVQIEIRMREKVPFKTVQSDNVLALDFVRR